MLNNSINSTSSSTILLTTWNKTPDFWGNNFLEQPFDKIHHDFRGFFLHGLQDLGNPWKAHGKLSR